MALGCDCITAVSEAALRKEHDVKKVILLLIVALLVAACGGKSDPTPTPSPAPTEAPTSAPTEAATEAPAAEEPIPGSAQEAIAQTLDVILHDIYFGENPDNLNSPPEWTVTAGSEVTVNMQNLGALEHDFAVAKLDAELPVPFLEGNRDLLLFESEVVAPSKSSSVTFTAPTVPGVYTVICTVAGHYPVMQGRLVVK